MCHVLCYCLVLPCHANVCRTRHCSDVFVLRLRSSLTCRRPVLLDQSFTVVFDPQVMIVTWWVGWGSGVRGQAESDQRAGDKAGQTWNIWTDLDQPPPSTQQGKQEPTELYHTHVVYVMCRVSVCYTSTETCHNSFWFTAAANNN